MEKKKILETIGEIIVTTITITVGSLVLITGVTFLYHMIAALFD